MESHSDFPHAPEHVHHFDEERTTITSVVSFPTEASLQALLSHAGFADLERFFTAYFYGGWVTRLQA